MSDSNFVTAISSGFPIPGKVAIAADRNSVSNYITQGREK